MRVVIAFLIALELRRCADHPMAVCWHIGPRNAHAILKAHIMQLELESELSAENHGLDLLPLGERDATLVLRVWRDGSEGDLALRHLARSQDGHFLQFASTVCVIGQNDMIIERYFPSCFVV